MENTITLLEACLSGNVQDFKAALSRNEDPNIQDEQGISVLSHAAKNRPDLVRRLIESGADVNLQNTDQTSALHWAVEYDNTRVVHLLLEAGARTDITDGLTETPLHWAGWTGHHRTASLLLEAGADPLAKNSGGFTALDLACKQELVLTIELLEKYT